MRVFREAARRSSDGRPSGRRNTPIIDAERRRWWIVAALVPAVLAVNLDGTILSLALPTLAESLHATTSEPQWFVSAYTLVFAAVMVPGGMLGDRIGRKKVLVAALGVFALGSIACAASTSAAVFIGARVLLAVGAAVVVPMVLGVLPVVFPTDTERRKAVAAVMAATMRGYPLGPILGGWLLSTVY